MFTRELYREKPWLKTRFHGVRDVAVWIAWYKKGKYFSRERMAGKQGGVCRGENVEMGVCGKGKGGDGFCGVSDIRWKRGGKAGREGGGEKNEDSKSCLVPLILFVKRAILF